MLEIKNKDELISLVNEIKKLGENLLNKEDEILKEMWEKF